MFIQQDPGHNLKVLLELAELTQEVKITLLQVSLTAGTGSRGSEFWKL